MAIPLLDLDHLAKACVDGDLDAFAAAPQLGWTLSEAAREALLHALANTNHHRWYSYGVSAFTIAQAIGLIAEAANNQSGIAITEQVRSLRLGKELAIAFRHAGQVHFGVRYASNLPMTPSHLWPELKPWYKAVERNRSRLERWVESAEGIVSVPLRASSSSAGPSGEELLAAVIAEPESVDARLVYADWLLARGDAQGELIQLCEQRGAHADLVLDARIAQLQQAYGERIAGEVAQLASSYTLGRGFVRRLALSAPSFAKHGERLLASHPIEQLDLKPVNAKALARLARVPALARIRVLYLSQIIGRTRPMPFDDLCRSPHFDALRRLELWTWETDGDPEQAFAQWRAPRLESLHLYEVDSSPRILAGLGRNELVQPRSLLLDLRGRVDWPAALAAPAFERLRCLQISTRGEEIGELFEGARLPAIFTLGVGHGFPAERLRFPSVRRLRLSGPIDAHDFAGLLERHPHLQALQIRSMDTDQVEAALATALALPSDHPLEVLAIPSAKVDPELMARVRARFGSDFYEDD
ncbi:MAG: TIGR02996 domain-containing protein [Enhygromyxa sp.]